MEYDIERLLSAKLLTASELAEILQLGRSSVYQFAKQGLIPYIAIGHSIRFDAADIAAWLESRKHGEKDQSPSPARLDQVP